MFTMFFKQININVDLTDIDYRSCRFGNTPRRTYGSIVILYDLYRIVAILHENESS